MREFTGDIDEKIEAEEKKYEEIVTWKIQKKMCSMKK